MLCIWHKPWRWHDVLLMLVKFQWARLWFAEARSSLLLTIDVRSTTTPRLMQNSSRFGRLPVYWAIGDWKDAWSM